MAVLQAVQGSTPGKLLPLEGESIVLGRHPACDIVLDSASVSRRHARILNFGGRYFVEDLQSRNGTLLNGKPISERQPLTDGDRLGICELTFVFFHTYPPKEPASTTDKLPRAAPLLLDDEQPVGGSTVMSKLTVAEGVNSLRLETNAEAKLKALLEISQSLSKAVGLAEVLSSILDSLFVIFEQADWGLIVLQDARTGRLVPKAVKCRSCDDLRSPRVSRTIMQSVLATKEAILSADAAADTRFDRAQSIADFQIRSMMCAPLVTRDGQALGVIQLDTLNPTNHFQQEDLDLLASVACQAAVAVENAQLHEAVLQDQALRRELAVAHEVQRGFLPAAAPRIPEYEFFDFYEPANQLGGDYYDYIELPGGRLAVLVADVSGKGISASLLMAKLSAETRYCLASEPDPAQAVARLNRDFCQDVWEDRFITMLLAVLDPRRHEVTLVNAGHLPPLRRRAAGEVLPLAEKESNLPLGVEAVVDYTAISTLLEPGEALLLYTDGITEAMNAQDELYGFQQLLKLLNGNTDAVPALGRRVLEDVKRFVGVRPQSDDMCLVCFGRSRM